MAPPPVALPPLPEWLTPPEPGSPRALILESARSIFSEHGYDSTTTRAIADRAGVNLAMVHYYYGSKEALYRRVLAGEMVTVARTIAASMIASERPAGERLLDMVGMVHRLYRDDPIRLAIVRREVGQGAPHGLAVIQELGMVGPKGLRRLLLTVIEEGQREGSVAAGDPQAILGLLFTGAFGMLFVSPMLSVVFDAAPMSERQWQRILEGQRALFARAILREPEGGER